MRLTPQLRFWANKYKTKFNEDATVFSVDGYTIINTFANAATKAGKNLTTDSFIKVMDTLTLPSDIFGSAPASFSPTKRLGSNASRLSQIQDGKRKAIPEYYSDTEAAPAKAAPAKKKSVPAGCGRTSRKATPGGFFVHAVPGAGDQALASAVWRFLSWLSSTGSTSAKPSRLIFKPGAIRHSAETVHRPRSQRFISASR